MLEREKLTITLPSDHDVVFTRDFDAPRALVFEAMTDPELVKQWLTGPPGWSMVECEESLVVGDSFRYVWHGTDGARMSMSGVNREVVVPERIVRTERFDFGCDMQAGEQLARLELREERGLTRMRLTVTYPSKEVRDGAIASGMEHGMEYGYGQLDAILASS